MCDSKKTKGPLIDDLWVFQFPIGELPLQGSSRKLVNMKSCFYRITHSVRCITLIFIATCFLVAGSAQAEQVRRVLVLNSYHSTYKQPKLIMSGIKSILERYKENIEIDAEYMDTKHFNDERHYENLYRLYKNKASRRQYDVIITVDNNAFLFLLRYREDLYPNVPVVFCGVDRFHDSMLERRPALTSIESILQDHDLVTGVMEAYEYESTIEVALKFHPSAKKVVIVSSDPNEGMYWPSITERDIAGLIQKFKGQVDFISFFLSRFNIGELLNIFEDLGDESIVFLTSDFQDVEGKPYSFKHGEVMILERCAVPIYVVTKEWFGFGPVIGGNLVSGFRQGQKAAEMVVRILDGESVRNIPILRESPNQYTFDYNQMKHFGISLSDVPEGSMVFNQPKSFYYQHRRQCWAAIVVVVILAVMVVILSANVLRRKRAEKALWIRSVAIESSINAIAFCDMKGILNYVNDSFLKLWGYSSEREVVGRLAVKFWADQEKAAKVKQTVIDEGSWVGELVAKRKDGSTFDVQLSSNLVRDKNGNPVCLMASFLDATERKRAEEDLVHSEAIYRMAIENASGVPYQLRWSDGKYVFMGSGVEELVGVPADKLTRPIFHKMVEKVIPVGTSTYKDVANYGKKRPVEQVVRGQADIRIRMPNGEVKWLNDSSLPFRDKQTGQVIGTIGILQDITDRKRAEKALRESETRYKMLFETAAEGILVADIETMEFKYANPALCRMLGYTEEELKRMSVSDIHPKESLEHVFTEFEAQARREKTLALNIPCLRKDGAIIYADINTANVLIDGRESNVGFLTDITERKRAEDALRESEERFRALTESTSDWVWEIDRNGVYTYSSPKVRELIGYEPNEIIGKRPFELMPPEEAKRVEEIFGDIIESREPFAALQNTNIHKDGRLIVLETSGVPIIDESGSLIGYRGIDRDITERKRIEEELQRARDELEDRVEQRTADLERANIELRNEINERQKVEEKLLIYQKRLRFLASELSLAEERLRRRIAIDVHDHIGQNLAISKIKIESLCESVSSPEHAKTLEEVRDLVAQTIKSMRSLMFELSPPVLYELGFEAAVEWLVRQAEKQHGFSAEFHNDKRCKPLAHNVRVFLFQAVRELLVNVAKHAHAQNVKVSTRRSGNQIRVSVEDDGVGFKVSEVHSHDYKKGGFGLFSIRERLGYINGAIDINSKPGKTRITLLAPINHKNSNGKEKYK